MFSSHPCLSHFVGHTAGPGHPRQSGEVVRNLRVLQSRFAAQQLEHPRRDHGTNFQKQPAVGCQVPYLVRLGDWLHEGELHRVFGCEIDAPIETFAADELLAIGWFTYEETAELAVAGKLRTGFELAAITEFRRHHASR